MGFRTISQIVMITAALFIIFGVIKPKLEATKVVQDEAGQYAEAVSKAEQYNSALGALLSQAQQFSRTQMEALEDFLPAEVDELSVMADITTMAENAGLYVGGLSRPSEEELFKQLNLDPITVDEDEEMLDEAGMMPEEGADESTTSSDFVLTATGDYTALKQFLVALENNKYPLEIVAFSLTTEKQSNVEAVESLLGPTSMYDFTMDLRAYSFIQ